MEILKNLVLQSALTTANELTTICKVSDLVGPKGQLQVSLDNLQKEGVGVLLLATRATGETYRLMTSTALSQSLRAKDIKLSDLGSFPIIEYTVQGGKNAGTVIPMVTMPQGSAITVGIVAEKFSKEDYKRASTYKPEELIAF